MTRREMDDRGWDACDIILVTGDAYVDHPSFGVALLGRWLEWLGYRVGVIAQPVVTDVESMRVLGRPALCWGITAGNLDSQLMRLTIMRKARHDDAYAPGGVAGARPANASLVYTTLARQAYKGVPVILGGVEASLRRFAYYDYWTDKVKRAVLFDAKAELLVYGMGERAIAEAMRRLRDGNALRDIPGTAEIRKTLDGLAAPITVPAFEEIAAPTPAGKQAFAALARTLHEHSDARETHAVAQAHGDRWLVVHPPAAPLAGDELDILYTLPFTRHPHPSYGDARIPAYEMIRDSITTHRGCYSGCSFCAIGAHQGTAITSRSPQNVLEEIARLTHDPDFHGTVSDLGGPTANMYGTGCRNNRQHCRRQSCLFPAICPHLNTDHGAVLRLMRAARRVLGVKHVFITSGIRCDLAMTEGGKGYIKELAAHHVGGRLKIAPEHIVPEVLRVMRKSDGRPYRAFVQQFLDCSRQAGKPQQIVEYFLSGHPGCTLADMIALAEYLHRQQITPEQVQDYYPVPLTLAAAMFYTGLDPLTGAPVYVARSDQEKALQRALLLCHKPEFHRKTREALHLARRDDLIGPGPDCLVPGEHDRPAPTPQARANRTSTPKPPQKTTAQKGKSGRRPRR
jgi:uncharacterized radical SAM protein YgiQ